MTFWHSANCRDSIEDRPWKFNDHDSNSGSDAGKRHSTGELPGF